MLLPDRDALQGQVLAEEVDGIVVFPILGAEEFTWSEAAAKSKHADGPKQLLVEVVELQAVYF